VPPFILPRAHHEPPTVFRYLRAAQACYVSSLHDGMNLVAKEFVAARDDERGVLVLSSFTGAARELAEALIVNPYDLDQAAAALAAAVMIAIEICTEHWFYLYIVWFLPALLIAIAWRPGRDAAEEIGDPVPPPAPARGVFAGVGSAA
jgi:hypothetical protein